MSRNVEGVSTVRSNDKVRCNTPEAVRSRSLTLINIWYVIHALSSKRRLVVGCGVFLKLSLAETVASPNKRCLGAPQYCAGSRGQGAPLRRVKRLFSGRVSLGLGLCNSLREYTQQGHLQLQIL